MRKRGRERSGRDEADRQVLGHLHAHLGPGDPAALGDQTSQGDPGAGLLLRDQHLLAPERGLGPSDGPPEPGLDGRDVEADVLPVQRVAHLGAQGVPGAEPAGQDAVRLTRCEQCVPERRSHLAVGDQLVAALTGVAGAADHDLVLLEGSLLERHVVVPHREADRLQHLVGTSALDRQHGMGPVVVRDGDAARALGVQPPLHLGGVGRVRNEQQVVVVAVVDDQVVDDAAGPGVTGQGVLRLAGPDPAEVVAQAAVQELHSALTAHHDLAEVADVEDADRAAHGRVLLEYAGRVLQRHLPAPELGELRPCGEVTIVERRLGERHAWKVTPAPQPSGAGCAVSAWSSMAPRDDVHAPQGQPCQDPHRPGGDRRCPDLEGRSRGVPRSRGRGSGVRAEVPAAARLHGFRRQRRRGAASADSRNPEGRPAARGRPGQAGLPDPGRRTPSRRRGCPQHRQRGLGRPGPAGPRRRPCACGGRRLHLRRVHVHAATSPGPTTPASPRSRSSATPRGARTRALRWRPAARSATS